MSCRMWQWEDLTEPEATGESPRSKLVSSFMGNAILEKLCKVYVLQFFIYIREIKILFKSISKIKWVNILEKPNTLNIIQIQ